MGHARRFGLGKVGDGEGDLENAVVGPGREPEAGDGLIEQFGGGGIQAAVFFDIPGAHLGIAIDPACPGKPVPLPHSRPVDPCADGRGRLAGGLADQLLDLDRRYIDMHVDPVEERPGQTAAVALHLQRAAGAGADTIT